MYQWVKRSQESGNRTQLYYAQEWCDTFVESDKFDYGHKYDRRKWVVEKKGILNPMV